MSYRETVLGSVSAIVALLGTAIACSMRQPSISGEPSGWLTVAEAAEYLNVTERFIRRLITQHRIAFHRFGRHVRLNFRDLDAFAEAGRVDVRP